jgi:hypothetical protein
MVELLDIGGYCRQIGREFFDDLDILKDGVIFQQEHGSQERLVDILGLHQVAGLTRKLQKLLDLVAAAFGFF